MVKSKLCLTNSNMIDAWVHEQMSPWSNYAAGSRLLGDTIKSIKDAPSVFIFKFSAGRVSLLPRDNAAPLPEEKTHEIFEQRARIYLEFFRGVLRITSIKYDFFLCVDLNDISDLDCAFPVFSFQKKPNTRFILLPDLDLIYYDYFLNDEYHDRWAFSEKIDKAIFTGSTTGGRLTKETIQNLSLPRLKSSVFFNNSDNVIFKIANIVQYEDPDVIEMVRSLGVVSDKRSWPEHFRYRYLISMDGNGAAPSRIAISLLSNCVLMKYKSNFELFYFSGLLNKENFVLVNDDNEVNRAIDLIETGDLNGNEIATSGRLFAERYLTRVSVMKYTADLLSAYGKQFGTYRNDKHIELEYQFLIDSKACFSGLGNRRSEINRWVGAQGSIAPAIEGFTLEPAPSIAADEIEYSAVLDDGSYSETCNAHQYCGIRGGNTPLRGFSVQLKGLVAQKYELTYEGAFKDGTMHGPLPAGTLCRSKIDAPLVGFCLKVRQRNS